jgi:hypothetical protein
MKKGYVILSGSVDGATCDDDGFINCANFALASGIVHKTLEEAKEIRKQIMETDLADFQDLWKEEDGYSIEQGEMNDYDGSISDTYIDVYYNGDVTNETIYKIAEVEYE